MEITTIDRDIHCMGIKATSFPEGITDAHMKLHKLVSGDRQYIGYSRPENGAIEYIAGAEMNQGEKIEGELVPFNIRKGEYVSMIITDYKNNSQSIKSAFDQLLTNPRIDPQGYCVEWYMGENDVQCMVPLQSLS